MNKPSDISIEKSSTLLYSLFTVVGLLIIHFGHDQLLVAFEIKATDSQILKHILIGSIAAGILLLSSEVLNSFSPGYRNFRREVEKILGPTSFMGGIYLAIISGVGEEILFRGALQPWLGLFVTSFVFGLLHLGPGLKVTTWTIWAIAAGFLLGWLFERTGSLVAPITGHILVNAFSIQRLRFSYQQHRKQRRIHD